jgi:hypothetical protein
MDEKERKIRQAFKNTNGIVEHEFPDEIVKSCAPRINEMIERIATGQTTFEQEDEALMKELIALNSSKSNF